MITAAGIRALTGKNEAGSALWAAALQAAVDEFRIRPVELWLTHVLWQTRRLTQFVVSFDGLSARLLAERWPLCYAITPDDPHPSPNRAALAMEYQPARIASHVYAYYAGNGPPESGDGWLYRGRFPPPLWGRAEYEQCAIDIGVLALYTNPDAVLADVPAMARIAGWYWQRHALGRPDRSIDLVESTRAWEGLPAGAPIVRLRERSEMYRVVMQAIGVVP